ncbi:MAG: AAA family ATPase [Lachnospiraceae bacterium]|nr:AAA family ATPase [Lachnospiraceae bacterium]
MLFIRNVFYLDNTYFMRDWYNSLDQVTLITRPRRFGKTLTLNMMGTFFSMRIKDEFETLL